MPTLLVFHEVDDVDHWLASPKREELLGPMGMTGVRTFRDTQGSNRVVGNDPQVILQAAVSALDSPPGPTRVPELWDGRAAPRIVDAIEEVGGLIAGSGSPQN